MSKVPVYFVPGLAAGKEIFRNINLPQDQFEVHYLEWLIPEKNESIAQYAQRMASRVTKENAVLIGVSFGGVVVQEMASFLKLQHLIIISSITCRQQMPLRLKLASTTKAYKLVPTSLATTVDDFTTFAIGPRSKKRLRLYNEYLSVRDKDYLDWAIKQMVEWKRELPDPKVVHIHGDLDAVFPIKYIQQAQILEGGTHVMILNKGSKVSKMLLNIMSAH